MRANTLSPNRLITSISPIRAGPYEGLSDDDNLAAIRGQPKCDRKPDDSGPDDRYVRFDQFRHNASDRAQRGYLSTALAPDELSIAGSENANLGFEISLSVLAEAHDAALISRATARRKVDAMLLVGMKGPRAFAPAPSPSSGCKESRSSPRGTALTVAPVAFRC